MAASRIYSFDAYDKNFRLKMPIMVMMAMLFGIKDLILVFLAYGPSRLAGSGHEIFREVIEVWLLLPNLLLVPLIVAWIFRHKTTRLLWLTVWSHGRVILLWAYAIHFLMVAVQFFRVDHLLHKNSGTLMLIVLLLDFIFWFYIWHRPIVVDLFKDYAKE
ncbi:DUF2919 family protein [Ectothiorhodospiraceae bacterium BW-2]|nr:DUF2919 family protein [Ectothiorhodospiraceae bacterium BW-2]